MTQLLGINSNEEIKIDLAFKLPSSFTEDNPDGWGYAFFNNEEWQLFKQSLDVDKVLRIGFKTLSTHEIFGKTFISHIRYATHGESSYENTHPFDFDLFDYRWVFAHYGHLRLYRQIVDRNEFFKAKGDTDSEAAFCYILEEIRKMGRKDNIKELATVIENAAAELSKQGGLNFLLSHGDTLFAYYSGYKSLYYAVIRPPFKKNIFGENNQIKFEIVTENVEEPISIISSEEIVKFEYWKELEAGKVYIFRNGDLIKSII